MGNWKELGVVPDSDDEGWASSEDSLPLPLPLPISTSHTPTKAQPQPQPQDHDIWDFPGSSEPFQNASLGLQHTQKPTTTPQSTGLVDAGPKASQLLGSTLFELDSDSTGGALGSERDSPDPLAYVPQELVNTNASPFPGPRDEISLSIVHITAASADPFLGNSLHQDAEKSSFEETSRNDDQGENNHVELPKKTREPNPPPPTQSESPVRSRRSFRPRKPIQEHPYLLENAQYSKLVKSHGVKPVRITAQEQDVIRRRNGHHSQDHEYSADESQAASARSDAELHRRHHQNNTERRPLDDEVDELALSQSQPPSQPPSPRTSSPQRHLRASSEQSPGQHTDGTSINDDDEFPDIRDLIGTNTQKQKRTYGKSSKRQLPSGSSTTKKRFKTNHTASAQQSPLLRHTDAWDLPPSPGPSGLTSRFRTLSSPEVSPRQSSLPRSTLSSASPPRQPSPPPPPASTAEALDLTHLSSESEQENEHTRDSDSSSSESDSELLRRTGRRIRGVLPASWLRLDQHGRKKKAPDRARRQTSPPPSPDQPRPGLAMRKSGTSKAHVSTKSFLQEMNEDTDNENATGSRGQPVNDSEREPDPANYDIVVLDDAMSVVEEDFVDWMLPGQKRNRTPSAGPPWKRKKTNQKVFTGETRKRFRQQKISSSVHRLDRPAKSASNTRPRKTGGRAAGRSQRAISPPALSIVDFVEPNAPNFIQIAGRAASRRKNMGRSKPSNKNIDLGNRADNVDALSVLKSWKTGTIKTSKTPRGPRQNKPQAARQPLRPLSANARRQPKLSAGFSFTQTQKLTRQVSIDHSVNTEESRPRSEVQPAKPVAEFTRTKSHARDDNPGFRPAQLEADITEDLTVRKKMLDVLFRKNRREVLAPTFQLGRSTPDQRPAHPRAPETSARRAGSAALTEGIEPPIPSTRQRKASRTRKSVLPKRLDLEAPQFRHANDPLPFDASAVEQDVEKPRQGQSRISSLGPFGTHYTQHFDIFPLHRDTFFHQTTILGNGTLKKALDFRVEAITFARMCVSFEFSDQTFSWGRWNDTTSSDLGQVFDQLTDQLDGSGKSETCPGAHQSIVFTDHILRYMLESVSVDKEPELRPFVQRCSGLLVGFMDQTHPSTLAQFANRTLLQVNSRFLICALVLLRFCQGTVELSDEAQQVEDMLKRLANLVITQLLKIGLTEVRATYDDLQRLAFRERGIRSDAVALNCWVIVIKVLGSAQMPRAGFWDLACSAMANDVRQSTDARELEGVWRDMFSLLPLGEFDDTGILDNGMRYDVPLQGWALPQKLLKCVFESYQSNQRQSPSFNEYCRALLGRCHHLIEHWGWHKCVGIVGTIFDFFGHQNLSHLRNEEVYRSPTFLEELSDGPCLSIEPEDRCFHIFLKILAVAIQNMKRHGLSNDARNLIARCLPNHNRQYSKEQTIHTHDLASLRNHHDLLCTLFWAADPEDRRPVDMIENLVQPASSHKEACLINLRAWSQLARYVVSSGGSIQEFRPFMSWQNNVFQQVLNQYLSAAADVQEQFMSLAKEARGGIQQQFLDGIVAANQTAAKDVLYCSVIASLDVMRCCPSLTSSVFSLNITQMSKVFNKLITVDKKLDWGILRTCFDTIDLFMKRLEDIWYKSRESTSDSASSHSDSELGDAVEFLDDKIVQGLFVAVRGMMRTPASNAAPQPGSASVIVEKAVILCGRIASLFIHGEKNRLQHFFTTGKYGLFEALPKELSLLERRFVPLFVATLLKNHMFNFSGLDCNHFDFWILSLVKPYHALRYENYFAETLKTLGMGYMEGVIVTPEAVPNYNKNRDFFASGLSYMRSELRKVVGDQKKRLRANYQKLLESLMEQMKTDIKSLELNSAEHQNYVSFVRAIVGLIRSHSVPNICPLSSIDPFYLRVSAEYSPAKEDPQLHTAGILSYGVRLGEGDVGAAYQLFWYLYNHFKESLASGQLDAESKIIENGLKDDNILAFVIGRMLPAIIQASSHSPGVWPLMGVYSKAVQDVLGRSYLPREIPEAFVEDVVALLVCFLDWLRNLVESSSETTGLTPTQAHIFTETMAICNAMRPSLICWMIQPSGAHTKKMRKSIDTITRVVKQAAGLLNERASRGSQMAARDVPVKSLLHVVEKDWLGPVQPDSDFARHLIREVQNKSSWVITSDRITTIVMTTSSAQPGTQSGQGVKNDLDTRPGLWSALLDGLKTWVDDMGQPEEVGGPVRRRRQWPRGLIH